jgi:hypothetical protein
VLLLACEMAIDANTHPTMVPVNARSWPHSNANVVKWMPMNFGSVLCPRKERLLTMIVEATSEGVWGVSGCEGLALGGSCDGEGGRRSAGCRAGKGSEGTAVWGCSSTCSWIPSMKPISPRFDGKGPACGLDSCNKMVEEEEVAEVDAMMGSSGKSGKFNGRARGEERRESREVKGNGMDSQLLAACTWHEIMIRDYLGHLFW